MSQSTMTKPGVVSRKIPPVRGGHFLLGSMPDIQRGPLDFFMSTARQYGDFVRFRFFLWDAYLVSDPASIKHVLQENNRNYNKQHVDYQMLKPLVGEGLLTSDGSEWLSQRRLIQPAFHKQRIQGFATVMTTAAEEMLDRWQRRVDPTQPLDITSEMMRITLSIAGKTLFSQDIRAEAGTVSKAFTILSEDISTRLRSPFAIPLSIPTPRNRRFHAAKQMLDEVVDEIILSRRQELASGSTAHSNDLLTMLLTARDEDTGEGMDDALVRDEVSTLLLAGHETTANTLSWTWYLLSENPAIRQRLQRELKDVLGGRMPTMDDLPDLSYTRKVIQEAMRLYPPAWIVSRKAVQEDEIGGYHIPANAVIEMCTYVVHRHPKYWENPDIFDPERFDPERSAARPAFAYFPFGGGPRLCIGRDFAMIEAQLLLAAVASRFSLELKPGHPVEPEPYVTLRPRYGLPMYLSRI
ncbi:MAG: cytochrome P450 [Chloroflexota bacterium]|nr:MAG: cytochrome P450 [Chloroflexota bacterium]